MQTIESNCLRLQGIVDYSFNMDDHKYQNVLEEPSNGIENGSLCNDYAKKTARFFNLAAG